jgi:hypothetical protein
LYAISSQHLIFDGILKIVIPAKAGAQCFFNHPVLLDTGFRRDDIRGGFSTAYKATRIALGLIRSMRR